MRLYTPYKKNIKNINKFSFIFVLGTEKEIKETRVNLYPFMDISNPFTTDIMDEEKICNKLDKNSASIFYYPSMLEKSRRVFLFKINKNSNIKNIYNLVKYLLLDKEFKNIIIIEYYNSNERKSADLLQLRSLFIKEKTCIFVESSSTNILYDKNHDIKKIFYSLQEKNANLYTSIQKIRNHGINDIEIIRRLIIISYNHYLRDPNAENKRQYYALEYILCQVMRHPYKSSLLPFLLNTYLSNIKHL